MNKLDLHVQVTGNVIMHNDLPLQQPESITEEPGHNVPNAGFNHQKVDEQNVENPKDTKNGVEDNAKKIMSYKKTMQMNTMKLKMMLYFQYICNICCL